MRSARALIALAVALSVTWIALVCYVPSGDDDLWWTLKVGDYILAERDVPRTALWTIDAIRDRPYVSHSWLAALVFSSVAGTFGLDAVPLIPTLIAWIVFGCLIVLARQLGASWLLSVTVADVVVYHVTRRMICRAEVFGYLYLSVALNLIAAYNRTRQIRYLALLVSVALLWVNSHASFTLLLALLPLVAAGRFLDAWRSSAFRRDALFASLFSRSTAALAATWVLIAATTLVNPYGTELVRNVLGTGRTGSLTPFIEEWLPLYATGSLPAHFTVPAGVLLATAVIGFRRLSFVSLLLTPFLLALALVAQRNITVFGIGAAFVLGDFAAGLAVGRRGRTALAALLAGALLAANVLTDWKLGFGDRSLTRHPSPNVTAQGLEFILRHVRGNVLNQFQLGGLLIYFGYPEIRVSMDSRADPYPPAYFRSFRRALYGEAWETRAFVDRYAIDHIIVHRETHDVSLRPKLAALPEFRVVYEDVLTVVLSRGAAAHRSGLPSAERHRRAG